jgi:hypothetical protein
MQSIWEKVMRPWYPLLGAAVAALVLQACAPKPEPVTVDVVYDKYGSEIVTQECRPISQPVNPTLPARLPVCECPPGTQPGTVVNVASPNYQQCVPIPPQGGNRQRGPNNP